MKCTDCNGSGKYIPLFGSAETCKLCGGSGEVVGVTGDLHVPAQYASDDILSDNYPINRPVMSNPNFQHVAPVRTQQEYVALAQRWDSAQYGISAGKFHLFAPGQKPLELGSSIRFVIADLIEHVYRIEFPSKGFRYIVPGEQDYDKTSQDHGQNPCVEHGVLFQGNAINIVMFEFFGSDETMGPSFVAQMVQFKGKEVIINSYYEQAASYYRLTF